MIYNKNLLFNPSFTFNIDGWTTVANASIAIYTLDSYASAQSLEVTKKNENNSGVSVRVDFRPDVVAGTTYVASGYVKILSGQSTSSLVISISWYDIDSELLSTSTGTSTSVAAGGNWTRLSVSASAPSTAVKASISVVQPTSGTDGRKFLVDALKLEVGSTPSEVVQVTDQGQKNKITNLALQNVYINHLKGMQLNADIVLNNFLFNTIDEYGVVWVITDIKGWNELPPVEIADLPRGFGDGSYLGLGRYAARDITIEGVFLPQDAATQLAPARERLLEAINLVKKDGWLIMNESPVKAARVRLSGPPEIATVNARGRTEFSIGLKAGDPIKYKWNPSTKDNYYSEPVDANDTVTIFNEGNTPVPAIFEIVGPTTGRVSVTNKSSGQSIQTLNTLNTLRSSKELEISSASVTESSATFTTSTVAHGLEAGDVVEVLNVIDVVELQTNFNELSSGHVLGRTSVKHNFAVGQVIRFKDVDNSTKRTIGNQTPSGTTNITITTGSAHGFGVGRAVRISGVFPSGYNGTWTTQTGTTGTTLVVNIGSNPGQINTPGTVCLSVVADDTLGTITEIYSGVDDYKFKASVPGTLTNNSYVIDEGAKCLVYSEPVSTEYDSSTQQATITTDGKHGYKVGDFVVLYGLGRIYDGTHAVDEITSEYKFKVKIVESQVWSRPITYSATTTISTLVFAPDSGPEVIVGDYITIFGVNVKFNGTYLVTNVSVGGGGFHSISYENRLDTAVSSTSAPSGAAVYISTIKDREEDTLVSAGKSYYGNVYNSISYPVVSVPSATSFTVSTPLSYDLTTSNFGSWTAVDALVRWKTETISIDTYTKDVAINGVVSGYRGKLDTLIDWIQLNPGNNVISFEDVSRSYISLIELANSTNNSFITTNENHGLIEGSIISVVGLNSTYQPAFSATSYTVTEVINSKKFKFTNNYNQQISEVAVTAGYIKEISTAKLNIYYRPGWIT
jgi:hypothetical protein